MPQKTAEEVYDRITAEGEYRTREIDDDVLQRMYDIAVDNAKFAEDLILKKVINWRVIFLLYYDSLRGLCEILLRLKGTKCSNHQGCFAYLCVNFPKLELDWNFFEKVRFMRNRTHYEGKSITKSEWREINTQLKLYVSTLKKEVEKRLK